MSIFTSWSSTFDWMLMDVLPMLHAVLVNVSNVQFTAPWQMTTERRAVWSR